MDRTCKRPRVPAPGHLVYTTIVGDDKCYFPGSHGSVGALLADGDGFDAGGEGMADWSEDD